MKSYVSLAGKYFPPEHRDISIKKKNTSEAKRGLKRKTEKK